MLFSSITFLFAFLPVVLLVYYISPRRARNLVLMVLSLLFYAWGEPKYIIVMAVSIVVGYTMGRLTELMREKERMRSARLMMVIAVVVNLGILFFFKYIDFFTTNLNHIPGIEIKTFGLSLPLGISFYTFQILSYSVDVYRGTVSAQKNFINLAAYITLFPQLIAGPIVRYETVAKELDERRESTEDFGDGAKRFVIGLGKKVLIANMAAELFDRLSVLSGEENTVILAWICSFAFTIQIYFDFSGYSDMAIGLGKMFGFHFLENFDYPYISKSITEFWRRWHISLSSWFRDYVYIPLGGNRGGKFKTIRNMFIVWLLTGFWHGAAWNFIIWGIYYFVLLILEKNLLNKFLDRLPKVIRHIYALFFINLGWVIFAYDDMSRLTTSLKNMFTGSLPVYNSMTGYYLLSYGLFLLIAVIASTPFPARLGKRIWSLKNEAVSGAVAAVFMVTVFTLSVAFLASEAFNPFIYFRF